MTEPRWAPSGALLMACVLGCAAAGAQAVPQSATAASAAERAQQETDRTMYWIRVLATKPAPPKAAPAPKAVAAVPAPAPVAKPAVEAHDKARAATTNTATNTANGTAGSTTLARAPHAGRVAAATLADPAAASGGKDDGLAAPVADAAPATDVASGPAAEPDPGLIQVKSVQPDFPPAVVRRVHKGNVEVRFEVEPGGTVAEAVVVESSNARLNEPAIEAVKQWVFKPTPTTHTALVNLVFDIDTEK